MIMFIALAAALPSPSQARDIRCVAALAIVASAQQRGRGWRDVEDLRAKGGEFAALVGVDVMAGTGASREAVRDQMLAASAALNKAGPLSRAEVSACIVTMNAHLAVAKAAEAAAAKP
jgi:hypothetical protein